MTSGQKASDSDILSDSVGSHLVQTLDNVGNEVGEEADYVGSVFDGAESINEVKVATNLRQEYAPWHHPVKQIVRDYQWADSIKKLLVDRGTLADVKSLKYFTLPGADLFDVRVLADALAKDGTKIEYFGFDSGYAGEDGEVADATGTYLAAESALRQAGQITDSAEILRDKLEDIALAGSHAAERLRQRGIFDVINIDACNHLGYIPDGRSSSMFDAMEALLAHQLPSTEPWLLLITTRANVQYLGGPTAKLQGAIHKNLEMHSEAFGGALAGCIGGKPATIAADMSAQWSQQGEQFLKLFSVGLGKHLLQYYHAQINMPSRVELISTFAYKVSGSQPDMLSLAFRISPKGLRVQMPTAGGAVAIPNIELQHAVALVDRAKRLWDLDKAIAENEEVRRDAVMGTEKLLASANYDLVKWREWLRDHEIRPMTFDHAA